MPTPEEIARDRANAEKILAGTLLVPTTTCRKCGQFARVSNNMHNLERPKKPSYGLPTGMTFVGEITICQNEKCRHVAMNGDGSIPINGPWLLRDVEVEIVKGQSFVMKDLPMETTEAMREGWRAYLAEMPPNIPEAVAI